MFFVQCKSVKTFLSDQVLDTKRYTVLSCTQVTLKQIQEGENMSLQDVLQMEYRIAVRCMQNHDFFEGVRSGADDIIANVFLPIFVKPFSV